MADFLTDEEMAALEKQQAPKSPDFLSDDEMAAMEARFGVGGPSAMTTPVEQMKITPEGLGRGALEALPTVGMMAGGFLGSSVGPLGAVGGASLGSMGGKALEQAGKEFFFDEGPKTRAEQYKELVNAQISGAMGEVGGQALGKVAGKAIEKAPAALAKLGSALTGISEQEIKTYASKADKIKALARSTDASTMEAADQIRQQFNKDIGNTIKGVNEQISSILSQSPKTVESGPILQSLDKYKSKLDPILWQEQIAQIDDLIGRVQGISKNGQLPVAKANEIKQYLQDKAASAYRNGDMFQIGKEAANAAKSGAATARQLVDEVEPQVTKLNATLQKFHTIEDEMNRNILRVGAPEAALMAAGTGGNVRSARALEQLGELTGTPMIESAQELAAMRTFTNPPLLPVDTTGKTATRMGAAAATGAFLGGGPIGGAIGGALTSPLALKSIIETGRAVAPAAKALTPSAPTRDVLYRGLIQKYFEAPSDKMKEEKVEKRPDQGAYIDKVKGTPYEEILRRSLENGGEQSLQAANYVLMNRDPEYRKLINEEQEV